MLRRLFPSVYEGWLVAASASFIVTIIGAVFFYGFGTIFNPIRGEFGWTVAAISLAFALRSEVGGIAAPIVGVLVDRAGARRVLLGGVVLFAAGIFLMSFIQNLWQFYAAMMLLAVASSATGFQTGLVATATWFEARRGRAMAVATLGPGFSGLFVVGVAWLVEAFGWREALRAMALVALVAGVAVGVNVRERPPRHPQPMDGIARRPDDEDGDWMPDWGVPVGRALRTRCFLLLSLGVAAYGFGTTAVVVHQIPFLEALGVSKGVAGSVVAAYTLTTVVGRLGFGFLADRFDKRLVLVAATALITTGPPVLAFADSLWLAIAGFMLIAVGFGGTIPVRPALLVDYFGTKNFGAMSGLMTLISTFGSFLGPYVLGAAVDLTDAYTLGWLVTAGVLMLAIPSLLAATPPRDLIGQYRPQNAGRVSTATGVSHGLGF